MRKGVEWCVSSHELVIYRRGCGRHAPEMVIDDSTQDICGPKICTTGFSSGSGLSSRPTTVSSSLLPVVTSIFVDVIRGAPGCFRNRGMISKLI